MLTADPDAFENAAMQLWHVASWMKGEDGSLVAPPSNDVHRYRSAIRGALALLFNAPVQIGDEKIVTVQMLRKTIDE